MSVTVTAVNLLQVGEGLYALRIGEITATPATIGGMTVPAAQVCVPPGGDADGVEIIASYPGSGPWFGMAGGTVILRSPPGGGEVIVTVYCAPGQNATGPSIDLQRIDGPEDVAGGADSTLIAANPIARQPAHGVTRDVPTEILLHIERAGDRLFPGRGWVGALGRRMRIEAFSIRPLERIEPANIEMKGFLPNGGETPWIQGGALCGTRGQGLPLIGFAVRIAPGCADRFDVVYQGSFFDSGISDPCENGDPCLASVADDPLEAVNVRLIERGGDPGDAL
jgi:hypothetical protein